MAEQTEIDGGLPALLHALCKLQAIMLLVVWATPCQSFVRLPTCAPGKEVLRWCARRGLLGRDSRLGHSSSGLRRLLHRNGQPHGANLQQSSRSMIRVTQCVQASTAPIHIR